MTQLKLLQDGFLKQKPIDSTRLPGDQKQFLKAGGIYNVSSYDYDAGHFKFALKDQAFQGKNTWYVWERMGYLFDGDQVVMPRSLTLGVPYFDQLQDEDYPYGSCNVTSIAMSLKFLGAVQEDPKELFPDELNAFCDQHGLDRHDPNVLAQLVNHYGIKDVFSTKATLRQVQEWLIMGRPCVAHGYFTASGHVVCLIGFDADGFFVNDPYGEWSPDGYTVNNKDERGKSVHYSYDMIRSTCMSDGEFWVHFIG